MGRVAELGSLGVIAIPFMFEAAFRTPVHFGVIWRKMIHAVIPAATFADGEFPELFTIHVQPRFCIGWDSAMRTPNHSLEPTASVPVRLAIEFICGFHTSVTRWLSFFVRRMELSIEAFHHRCAFEAIPSAPVHRDVAFVPVAFLAVDWRGFRAEVAIAPVADFTSAVFAAADIHVHHPRCRRPDFLHEVTMFRRTFSQSALVEFCAIAQQILGVNRAIAVRSDRR